MCRSGAVRAGSSSGRAPCDSPRGRPAEASSQPASQLAGRLVERRERRERAGGPGGNAPTPDQQGPPPSEPRWCLCPGVPGGSVATLSSQGAARPICRVLCASLLRVGALPPGPDPAGARRSASSATIHAKSRWAKLPRRRVRPGGGGPGCGRHFGQAGGDLSVDRMRVPGGGARRVSGHDGNWAKVRRRHEGCDDQVRAALGRRTDGGRSRVPGGWVAVAQADHVCGSAPCCGNAVEGRLGAPVLVAAARAGYRPMWLRRVQ